MQPFTAAEEASENSGSASEMLLLDLHEVAGTVKVAVEEGRGMNWA